MNRIEELRKQMAFTIRSYNTKGWSPATSTNYSFRDPENDAVIFVSRSGVDKSLFTENDFITVDRNGNPVGTSIGLIPSAETLIHCVIYDLFPETQVILHSHSVYPVLISQLKQDTVEFEGYEIQKGFAGQTTHDARVVIPVFDNTQDMNEFSKKLITSKRSLENHSFIMRKHGTYAWGKNLFEAKRHLETLEYLCQCTWMSK